MKKLIFSALLILQISLAIANQPSQGETNNVVQPMFINEKHNIVATKNSSKKQSTESLTKKPQLIDVTFQIVHDSNNSKWRINNNLSLRNNNRWLSISELQASPTSPSLQNQQSPSIQSLALIKIVNADSTKVTLEFLMINKEFDYYSVNQPRLIINYNQTGDIDILDNQNNHTKISAIAHIKA